MTEGTRLARHGAERAFFTAATLALAGVVFLGFARTYYLRPLLPAEALRGERPLTPLIHVHGLLFGAWMVLLVVQARLVAARHHRLHGRLGLASLALAGLMIGVGTITALHAVVRGVAPGGMDPRRFLVVPLFALAVFAVLYAAAVGARRRPQAHKRLVLLATLGLLPPALARFLIFHLGFGPPVVMAVSLLFLVPLVAWDLRTLGRLHPATLWGGLFLVASVPGRLALASTGAWLAFADGAVALLR